MANWHFIGDVNPEHGGTFIDLDNWDDGYCNAVVVTDLDSGCGFRGAVMVEHVVINGVQDRERVAKALGCCGWWPRDLRKSDDPAATKLMLRHMIAEALCSYGYKDADESWGGGHHTEILQLDDRGPMRFDGWKADKRLCGTTLEDYVQSQHLGS